MTVTIPRPVLTGSKALIIGVANESSIAYGCAKAMREVGADLALTYLNEKAKRFVDPLAEELGTDIYMPLDVAKPGELEAVFEQVKAKWGKLDILVHSIAFAPKEDLQGQLLDCSAEGLQGRHGRVVPLVRAHGEPRRAAHDGRRHDVRDELSRRQQGRAHL